MTTERTDQRADAAVDSSIDEAMIERLIRHFYGRVRVDPVLAPIFAEAIPGDWEPHLKTMMRFWSSVMLMSGRYKGTPMQKHMALKSARPEHFDRWMGLFEDSARTVCPPVAADTFVDRAHRIAASLKLGMFGALLGPDG